MESDKLAKAKMIRLGHIFRPGPVIRLKGEIRVGLTWPNDAFSFAVCTRLTRARVRVRASASTSVHRPSQQARDAAGKLDRRIPGLKRV